MHRQRVWLKQLTDKNASMQAWFDEFVRPESGPIKACALYESYKSDHFDGQSFATFHRNLQEHLRKIHVVVKEKKKEA